MMRIRLSICIYNLPIGHGDKIYPVMEECTYNTFVQHINIQQISVQHINGLAGKHQEVEPIGTPKSMSDPLSNSIMGSMNM